MRGDNLTGRIRYRRGWRNKLVLQVEYKFRWGPMGERGYGWRDARVTDLRGDLASFVRD